MTDTEQPEPVAWINYFDGWSAPDDKTLDWHRDNNASRSTPLYAVPSQREWVVLTDEEIEGAIDEVLAFSFDIGNVSNKDVIRYVRVIEAKLKEKNS